jgi:hypothetical protein
MDGQFAAARREGIRLLQPNTVELVHRSKNEIDWIFEPGRCSLVVSHDGEGLLNRYLALRILLSSEFCEQRAACFSANPSASRCIESLGNPAGVANDYGVWRATPCDESVCADDAISTDYHVAFIANDCCALTDPTTTLDANSSTVGNALTADRAANVLVGVIVVLNEHGGGHDDIPFYVNPVLRGYRTSGAYRTVVIDRNGYVSCRAWNDM